MSLYDTATARALVLDDAPVAMPLAVLLAVLAVKGYELTLLNLERTFGDSTLSYGWVTAAVPVSCVLLGASLVNNMVHAFRRRRQGALVYSRTAIDRPAPAALEL